MELRILLCAEGVLRDAKTNNISIYNILEEYNSPWFPIFAHKLFVFGLLEREPDEEQEAEFNIKIENNEKIIQETQFKVNFQDKYRNRFILEIEGIVVERPGNLTISAVKDGITLGSYKILVNHIAKDNVIQKE